MGEGGREGDLLVCMSGRLFYIANVCCYVARLSTHHVDAIKFPSSYRRTKTRFLCLASYVPLST